MTRRAIAVLCVWTLPSALCLVATAIVYGAFRIPAPDRLDAAARAQVMAPLRAALDPSAPAGPAPAVRRALAGGLAVTVWLQGTSIARVDAQGGELAAATLVAAQALRGDLTLRRLSPGDRAAARLQVDLITGGAPLGGGSPVFDRLAIPGIGAMLAVNPGVEGIAAEVDGKPVRLLPHELVARKLLAAKRPFQATPELAIGVDLAQIGQLLADRAGRRAPVPPGGLIRFRTDTFVEPPGGSAAGPPLALYRGLPDGPPVSRQALRDAALRGGRYLVAHLTPGGRYVYEHDLWTGWMTNANDPASAYSTPRHAGTTYFLAELYRITGEPWLREPIERAIAHLASLVAEGRCAGRLPDGHEFACVVDRGEVAAQLGATALTVVALAEYQRATGDRRHLPLAIRLTAWLRSMQRPDGSFRHVYDVATRTADELDQQPYYSGEAALALARMAEITGDGGDRGDRGDGGDRGDAAAAIKALDWLVDWYDFFLAGFFYGEEHWTCIAAEAIWPRGRRDRYRTFCGDYGEFLRAQQADPGATSDEADYAGAYHVTPFVPPYNTPAGSRTEAMISAYQLGVHHGAPDPRLAQQIRATLGYALRQQLRPDSAFAIIGPGDGAMPGTPIDRTIRIDYVQHVCSAMIRASEWIDDAPRAR